MVMREFKDLPSVRSRERQGNICALCAGVIVGTLLLVVLALSIDAAALGRAAFRFSASLDQFSELGWLLIVLGWGTLLWFGAIVVASYVRFRSMARDLRRDGAHGSV